MRRDVFRALGSDCTRLLPRDVVDLILELAYDVRCGNSSVQYFFWLSNINAPMSKCQKNTGRALKSGRESRPRRGTASRERN